MNKFHFKNVSFDRKANSARLAYSIDDREFFEETITFENAPQAFDEETLGACLRLLHIACGVSYYKTYLPGEIVLENTALTEKEAEFFNLFYTKGLGEFAFRNSVSLNVRFPFSSEARPRRSGFKPKKQVVLPIGGGKDSIVSLDLLEKAGKDPVLFSVGLPRPIKDTIALSGKKSILVSRKISENLIELNKKPGVLNGHVPISGLIAFILACSSVIYDFSDAALSNERSADAANIRDVNHQWSKSLEFERAFGNLMTDVLPEFRYFSLLRPMSEIAIAKRFSACAKYHGVFTSCNRAFALDPSKRRESWCGACDKCRFVFLALAPFMEKQKLLAIFKTNPLDDISQKDGFLELLGLKDFKPFECVGEIRESVYAFSLLKQHPEWQNDAVVRAIDLNAPYDLKRLEKELFAPSSDHLIPKEYLDALSL